MSKITGEVNDVPVYDGYVYYQDWLRVEGIRIDDNTSDSEREYLYDNFCEVAEAFDLEPQDC